jgi:hypothetical protein
VKNKLNSLCHQLLSGGIPRSRALIGFLLAMCSNTQANSVVQLSLSPFFQHQYSSITDLLSCLGESEAMLVKVRKLFRQLAMSVLLSEDSTGAQASPSERLLLSVDVTPCVHPFAHTLAERKAVALPNPMFQSYHLGKGYHLSSLNAAGFDGSWSLPLSLERVGPHRTASGCAHDQVAALLADDNLGLSDSALVVLTADSGYGNVPFLLPLRRHTDLVVVGRLRAGLKTYVDHRQEPNAGDYRSDKVYGATLYLTMKSEEKLHKTRWHDEPQPKWHNSISERPFSEREQWQESLNSRQVTVIVERWSNLLLRGKVDGEMMGDHPVDIVRVQHLDAQTGDAVFGKEMYLVLSGQRRGEISARQARQDYLYRKDTESYFRTAKRRMLLDKFQTCCLEHLDAFLPVVQLAGWMTYATAGQAELKRHPWERYLPEKNTTAGAKPSFAYAIRAAGSYLGSLDLKPYAPQNQKGGKGRLKGYHPPPRKRHPVVRKSSKKAAGSTG